MKAKQIKEKQKKTYEALLANVGNAQKGYERAKSKETKAKHALKTALKNTPKADLKILELQYEKLKHRRKARKASYKIAELQFKMWSKTYDVESKVYTLPEETEKPKVRKTRTVSTQHLKEAPIIATPVVTAAPPVVEKVKQTRRKSSDVQAEKDAVTAALKGDDFRIVEGMGLRITQLFHENGVKTFNQLASLDYDAMKGFLRANGFKLANPTTWGDQAKLAAEGKMDELENFKKSLSRGLRVQ